MTKAKKIKIGIIGEHPNNDAMALSYLLKSGAPEHINFVILQKNHRGSQLDSMKFYRSLKAEFIAENPKYIIFVRDLDGLRSEQSKIAERDHWFEKANKEIKNCGIFFLAIYEMESLILSDIDNLNKYYRLKEKAFGSPMEIQNPKEVLQKLTENSQKGKYSENNAPEIFKHLSFINIYQNHKGERSFQFFADVLAQKKIISFSN